MTKAKVKSPGNGDIYEITLDGVEYRLPRVTSVIDKVMSQGKSGMAYWGGQLAIQYTCTLLNEMQVGLIDEDHLWDEDEWYEGWKASSMNPIAMRDSAGDRGKAAHHLLEALLDGSAEVLEDGRVRGADDFVFEPTSYALAVVKFYTEYFRDDTTSIVYPESRVYSVEHGFAGTADIIAEDDSGTVIFDLKTHKPPARFSDMLQMSAYGLAWEEMHPGKIVNHHCIVLAQENGEYITSHGYVHPDSFLALKRVYDEVVSWQVA